MFYVGFGDFNIIIGIVIFIALVITLVWTLIKDGRQDSTGKKITAGEKNTDRKDLSAMSPLAGKITLGKWVLQGR